MRKFLSFIVSILFGAPKKPVYNNPADWEYWSKNINKPYPINIDFKSGGGERSCSIRPQRYVNGKFDLIIIVTNIKLVNPNFPRSKMPISKFTNGQSYRVIRVSNVDYTNVQIFCEHIIMALEKGFDKENAFIWAMKKLNYY